MLAIDIGLHSFNDSSIDILSDLLYADDDNEARRHALIFSDLGLVSLLSLLAYGESTVSFFSNVFSIVLASLSTLLM